MSKISIHFWRWTLILLCLAIAGMTFIYMNKNYDSLARYRYVEDLSEEGREVILENLDSEDIDYMIIQQLKPGQVLPFIELEDFNIRNTPLYAIAQKTQPEDAQSIVYFINRYRDNFDADSLKAYLSHYSYDDLTNFIETQLVLHEDQVLVQDPTDPYLVLKGNDTVYKYIPENLAEYKNILVQEDMVENLEGMAKEYKATMDNKDTLKVAAGYMSYEDVLSTYNTLIRKFGSDTDILFLSGGQNEMQLGYTIWLEEEVEYLNLLAENPEFLESRDFKALMEKMPEEMQEKYLWLSNNAWRFGFILRYEQNTTKNSPFWQPFVLRYVGKENARAHQEAGRSLENFKFTKE